MAKESNKYYKNLLVETYGFGYKNIILSQFSTTTYQYLYVTRGISKEDILAFIGVKICMGLYKLPSVMHYWKKGFNKMNINKIMCKNYYYLIGKALHFPEKENEICLVKEKEKNDNDSTTEFSTKEETKIDPRHKVNLYLETLAKNFQKYYLLGQNIVIDESLVFFKGKNSMKYYIPMKPHKWGFKIHLLCDSDTSYLYNMVFDPGRGGKDFLHYNNNSSLTESIVLRLLSCINDKKQRNLFCDGWYSSINLMKKLTDMGYLITTVLKSNSKEVPNKLKLKQYDRAYNDEILIQKYEGKKTILFATNYEIEKEKLRNLYNIKNRGVDTFDHYLALSSIQRQTVKWYKKIFYFGIDAAIINSKIICELKTGRSYTTAQYKEKLYEKIFDMYNKYIASKFDGLFVDY